MNNLNEIFNDPLFDTLMNNNKYANNDHYDTDFERFQEIIEWVKEHNGKEPQKSTNRKERQMYSRLKGFRSKPQLVKKLQKLDEFNLLNTESIYYNENKAEFDTLDKILEDESFLNQEDDLKSLLDISRYKKVIQRRSHKNRSSRREFSKEFQKYESLFKNIKSEIAEGNKKIISVDTENNIKPGRFYIDNGILLYVLNMSEYFEDENGYRNARLHLVYENGTENKNILLRSFASNLFDKSRNGRMITKQFSKSNSSTCIKEDTHEYLTTGYIYVVKSLSNKPDIQAINNLYKIGFSRKDVKKRISNAENEATYLYAPVEIIATWKVQNVSAQKLETALHHMFSPNQLRLSINTVHGKIYSPKEWYIIPLSEIKEGITSLIYNVNL